MASISTVVTMGYGSFGSVNLVPTIGYGIGAAIDPYGHTLKITTDGAAGILDASIDGAGILDAAKDAGGILDASVEGAGVA